MKRWIKLLQFLLASFGAGFVGTFATQRGLEFWYQTLNKPSWNPPNWLFAPVWTILYALMGVAAWQVWESHECPRKPALTLFYVQLVFNALWTWLFFGWQRLAPAFGEIVLLWVAILVTMIWFFKVRRSAGWMLTPYVAWVTFAACLNFAIWRLNP